MLFKLFFCILFFEFNLLCCCVVFVNIILLNVFVIEGKIFLKLFNFILDVNFKKIGILILFLVLNEFKVLYNIENLFLL